MSRVLRAAIASVLAALIFASVAVAAIPVNNGVYDDGPHHILIGLKGQVFIGGFDMTCHGKTWVARMIIGIHADGTFSYRGADRLYRNRRPTKTTGFMTASGVFETRNLAVGHASAGGCSTSYRAVRI
ncbi:MAG TPA: hypothetical protein VG388_02170 [Solirubrobacteraceae bacterium]|jgi:hypothetical protein|nr:hypothetical protein [Solirubrobacteraceae bacterium]